MPDRYPDYPHHTPHLRVAARLRRRVRRCAAASASTRRRDARRARRRTAAGRSRSDDGSHARLRRAARLQRAPLGPALPVRSPAPSTGRRSTRTTTSTRPTRSTSKASACSSWASATAPWTSSPSSAARRCRETVFLSTRSGAYVVPKYLFGKPADQVVKTNPLLPATLQRRIGRASCRGSSRGGWRTSACRRPTTTSSTRTRRSPASCSAGSAPATRSPRATSPSCSATRCASPTARSSAVDAIIYATGYNVSFPFFDDDFLSRARQRAAAVQADAQTGDRRPRVRRPRAADPHDLPVRRAAVEARRALAQRRLGAAGATPRWKREIVARRGLPQGHFIDKPRHTMQLEWYSYKRELEHAHDPARPGARARRRADRRARRRARARRRRTALAGGRRSLERARRALRDEPQRRSAIAGVHLRGEGEAFADADRPAPVRGAGARLRRDGRLGADALRRALRGRRAGRARVRLPPLRRQRRRAPPAALGRRASSRTTPRRSRSRAALDGVDPDRDRRLGLLLLGRARRRGRGRRRSASPP